MKKDFRPIKEFYGTTTLGQKGQLVVPVSARKKLKLKIGDKFLVFSAHNGMLVISKLADFQKFALGVSRSLTGISKIIRQKNRVSKL